MASAGFSFWWLPEEETAFVDHLEKQGTFAIMLGCAAMADAFQPLPVRELLHAGDTSGLLIGPERFARAPVVHFFAKAGSEGLPSYCVSEMTSCLLRYRRARFRTPSELGAAMISAFWTRLNDAQNAVVQKDPEFRIWGTEVLAWIRKATPAWHGTKRHRMSRRVKESIEAGKLTIVP